MNGDAAPDRRDALPRSAAGDRNPWLIAVIVSIATFMLVLDSSIANVALRYIAGSMAAGLDESTWVITTYLVANAVIIPISGWLADVIGRKRFYMICVAIFTIASFFCGLAPNLATLIVFRIIQGLGGGGMAPSEQAILADTFPPEKRAQAFALYGVAVIVAPTVGPTLGGWITDNYSWHWIFLINVPIGAVSLALVHWLVVEPPVLQQERQERLRGGLKIDWVGFLLIALALGCLEVVLDRGEIDDWFQSNFILTFAIISAVSFAVFFPWELTRQDPIVHVGLLCRRQFAIVFLIMLGVGGVLFGSTQLLPQLLQTTYQYTAKISGLALMPGGFAMLLMMPIAGQAASRIQPKYTMAIATAVLGVAMLYGAHTLVPDASFNYFAWIRALQMIALPFLFVPINTVAYSGLEPELTNQASALINVARNLGGSIGVSVANAALTERAQFHQSRLVENIFPASPVYQNTLRNVTKHFAAQGASLADAQHQAIGWIGQTALNQATLLSYIDVFWIYAVLALGMIPLALLLRRVDLDAGGKAPAMH
ncbi:MAG: DHA2 family efflux MFS transporter permease subunit [Xanthobacteraceae bacterium]|nr:DHA2 family efflux MFS transporter permease subunit [Xanthobacteraceae bacterium]